MTDEFSPVSCPVDDCDFEDPIRSVAAHVARTEDGAHAWDRLEYGGPREFVKVEKASQRAGNRERSIVRPDGFESGSGAVSGSGSASEPGGAPGAVGASRDEAEGGPLDRTFLREAAAVDALLERYDAEELDELDPFRLANLYALLSALASDADDARKTVRDELLEQVQDDRTIETDVGDVSRRTADRRRLRDDETVRERLESAGVDPQAAMSFDSSKVEEAVEIAGVDPDDVFETERRAYVRRDDVDREAIAELLGSLDVDGAVGQ